MKRPDFPINQAGYDRRLDGSSRLMYGLSDPDRFSSLHIGADERNHRLRLTSGTLGITFNQSEGIEQRLKALIQTPGYEIFGVVEVVKQEKPGLYGRGYVVSRLPYGDNSEQRATTVDEVLPGNPALLVPSEASQAFHPDWGQWAAAVDVTEHGRLGIELKGEGGLKILTPNDDVHQELPYQLWAPRSAALRTVMEAGHQAMAGVHQAAA